MFSCWCRFTGQALGVSVVDLLFKEFQFLMKAIRWDERLILELKWADSLKEKTGNHYCQSCTSCNSQWLDCEKSTVSCSAIENIMQMIEQLCKSTQLQFNSNNIVVLLCYHINTKQKSSTVITYRTSAIQNFQRPLEFSDGSPIGKRPFFQGIQAFN